MNKKKLRKAVGLSRRDGLRLRLGPVLARMGRIVGMKWPALGLKIGRETLIAQARSLWPVRAVLPAEKPLRVVFMTMMGGNHRLCSTEVLLGRILQARGHQVSYVLCDQMLPACEVKWQGKEYDWQRSCAKCYEFGRQFVGGAGYDILPASDLIAGQQDQGAWKEYVDAALLKHYHVGVLPQSPEVAARRELFVQAAQVTARVGKALAAMKPDRVVMSHGIYCTWGPAREVLLEASIPVLTYGEGKKKDTIKFNWNTSADWWDVSKEWQKVRDVPLTAEQEKTIDDYLASRRTHSKDARVYNFGREETLEETRRRLNLEPDKQTFVLFTNVLWDAASAQREIAFKNPIEWVTATIAWFAGHPDKQLVVKIHPAEVVIGTSQPFALLIRQEFPNLPANVRVIEPHEKVNSWSIMRVADLGLVHTSTIGMELQLEGIPVAVVSKTHFRGRGFTIDVNSRQEYFDLIEQWDGSKVDRQRLATLSKRYAYLLFERYQLHFPFLFENRVNDVRAMINIEEASLLTHPSVQVFLRGFENRQELLVP
ncbi:MAG: hypothetical protein LLG01_16450 [Planctomycetaceae bacterium]|nr:hypothetical protein [Planctomycetaceae bacterium]